jgi:Outer membrane protein beta-barrel domain
MEGSRPRVRRQAVSNSSDSIFPSRAACGSARLAGLSQIVLRFKSPGGGKRSLGLVAARLTLFLAFTLPASAQVFEVTPLFGYRMGGTIKAKNEGDETFTKSRLKDGFTYGLAAGYRFDEESVIEFRWARQHSRLRLPDPIVPGVVSPIDTTIDQFHCDFTHEYEWDVYPRIRPYVLGSAGATRIGLPGENFTRFSFGLGGGMKISIRPRVRWRIQAEWLPIWIEPEARGLTCRSGVCAVFLSGTLTHQFEVSFGPVFHF